MILLSGLDVLLISRLIRRLYVINDGRNYAAKTRVLIIRHEYDSEYVFKHDLSSLKLRRVNET